MSQNAAKGKREVAFFGSKFVPFRPKDLSQCSWTNLLMQGYCGQVRAWGSQRLWVLEWSGLHCTSSMWCRERVTPIAQLACRSGANGGNQLGLASLLIKSDEKKKIQAPLLLFDNKSWHSLCIMPIVYLDGKLRMNFAHFLISSEECTQELNPSLLIEKSSQNYLPNNRLISCGHYKFTLI